MKTLLGNNTHETNNEYKIKLLKFLTDNASPFRFKKLTWRNFISDFGTEMECTSPIGIVSLEYDQFEKMENRFRHHYFGLVKPTLENPLLMIKDKGDDLFVKSFINNKSRTIIFFSIVKTTNGEMKMRSAHEKSINCFLNKIRENNVTMDTHHFATALNGSDKPLPNYEVLCVGIPYFFAQR